MARAVIIMSHPIPDTHESHSAQVIIPQKQLGRKSDMYVSFFLTQLTFLTNGETFTRASLFDYRRYLFCCSYYHNVAPKGKYIAFVLTEAETDNPEAELKPGVDLLGPVDEIFYETYDRYKPTNDCDADHCYISMVCATLLLLRFTPHHI